MNPRKRTTLSVFAAISAAVALSGCGGSGTFSPAITGVAQPVQITVTVNPPAPTIFTSTTQQFTATVTGTNNQAVVWSVSANNGGNPGTISSTGLYTAPNSVPSKGPAKRPGKNQKPGGEQSATITITATSVVNSDAVGTATATLEQSNISVSVTPQGRTILTGQTLQMTATVTGTSNTAVIWSVSSSANDSGTISSTGLYTAPSNIPSKNRSGAPGGPPLTVTITATSAIDSNSGGTATVVVENG